MLPGPAWRMGLSILMLASALLVSTATAARHVNQTLPGVPAHTAGEDEVDEEGYRYGGKFVPNFESQPFKQKFLQCECRVRLCVACWKGFRPPCQCSSLIQCHELTPVHPATNCTTAVAYATCPAPYDTFSFVTKIRVCRDTDGFITGVRMCAVCLHCLVCSLLMLCVVSSSRHKAPMTFRNTARAEAVSLIWYNLLRLHKTLSHSLLQASSIFLSTPLGTTTQLQSVMWWDTKEQRTVRH